MTPTGNGRITDMADLIDRVFIRSLTRLNGLSPTCGDDLSPLEGCVELLEQILPDHETELKSSPFQLREIT